MGKWRERVPVRRTSPAKVLMSGVRSTAAVALMLLVYYVAPFNHRVDALAALWLALGLLGLTVALVWQVSAISNRSDTPMLRAAQTIAVGVPLLFLLYASVYLMMAISQPTSFNEPIGRTDALYFTITVFATVGFGDIVPTTEAARVVTMTQMAVGLVVAGALVRVLFGAARSAVGRKAPQVDGDPDAIQTDDPSRR